MYSDVLTIIQRAAGPEYHRLVAHFDESGEQVVVTIITVEEQVRGWMAYIAKQRSFEQQLVGYDKLHAIIDDYATRTILDFDDAAAGEAERLRRERVRIGTMDLKIAAIAIATGSRLLTRNSVDFQKVPGLELDEFKF